jgi:pimeloyl-ACP methyl ester carboxylesterase
MAKDLLIADGVAVSVHEVAGSTKGVILSPGFLDSKDYPHLVLLAEELQKQGFTVARVDAFGTWASKGSIGEYALSRRLKDIDEAVNFLKKEYGITTFILGGHSMGGRVSAFYAVIHPECITGVVGIMSSMSMGSALNWPEDGLYRSKRDLPGDFTQIISFEVPKTFVEDSSKLNPKELLTKLRLPMLFIAGGDDKIVSLERMREGFSYANEPKEFVVIPGIGHDYRKFPGQISLVNEQVLKFIKENNL